MTPYLGGLTPKTVGFLDPQELYSKSLSAAVKKLITAVAKSHEPPRTPGPKPQTLYYTPKSLNPKTPKTAVKKLITAVTKSHEPPRTPGPKPQTLY